MADMNELIDDNIKVLNQLHTSTIALSNIESINPTMVLQAILQNQLAMMQAQKVLLELGRRPA